MLAKIHVVACQVISRRLDLPAATDEEVVKMTAPICPTAIIAFFGIFGQFTVAFTAQHTIHPVQQLEAVIQLGGLLKVINPASRKLFAIA